MLKMKRSIVLKDVEKIEISYDFLTDEDCVKIIDSALLDLTQTQFCWNDIIDKLPEHKHKFGNDKEVGTFVLWIDYEKDTLQISIYKVQYYYYLSK